MVGHPEDRFYDTPQMLDRIRPKARYDVALVAGTVVLALAIIFAAAILKPRAPYGYVFMQNGAQVFVGDAMTGEVSVCLLEVTAMICGEADSPLTAQFRRETDLNDPN